MNKDIILKKKQFDYIKKIKFNRICQNLNKI